MRWPQMTYMLLHKPIGEKGGLRPKITTFFYPISILQDCLKNYNSYIAVN